jgi:hypothetical protein
MTKRRNRPFGSCEAGARMIIQTESRPAPAPRDDLTWFVLVTRSGAELDVVESLGDLDVEAWCPCETRWNRSRRRKEPRKVPLLGGYVFVGLDPYTPFVLVLAVEGALAFLGGSDPRAIHYGQPTSDFHAHRDDEGERSLWELREMEAMGVFDLTKDSRATKAAKKARTRLHGLASLAVVKAEMEKKAA